MIYSTGTISINENTATGSGTNWTAPASQVRAGQTIIVMSNPVQMFQISSVNSATSMKVTPAASPALSGQKYGILVSDNISVDGLALAMSQLIKEYDENIGAWETFATTSANQNITVTINGTSLSIPALGKLLQKGSNGALPVNQGGTGATNAADARANLGLGYGTKAGTVAQGNDERLNTVNGKSGGNVTGSLMVTQGSSIGVSTQEGGDKTVKLYNITGDGTVGSYVNAVGGAWYNGNWSLGGVRGSGTNLDIAQLNVNSGTGTAGSFLFYPDERFKSSSCGADGAGYGGSWSDINTWQRNISFFRGNVSVNNDTGFIPFARWHSQCSGGYSSTVGLGSIATGPSSWADVAITTLGDGGSAGQRIFQFTTANGDIYANAGGNISGNYIFQKQPNCDITLKHDIKYDDGYQSYENIKKFLPATYVYNDDPRERVRRGVIAQDAMKIDSEYVKLVPASPAFDSEGNRIDADDTLALDTNVIMLDTVLALNYVIKKLEATQNELEEIKQKIAAS
ncbi:tail fiber domain-containing protein [Escherichia coli]|uniref:tail fiber domain-containing protein n=1 Tax=Escherichia coli TaxID=562 RepID=UPI000BE6B7EA|nr:tail fiber domain-containing protein [Escherichia coli]MBB9276466.1 tail fiber domain-containing protein [Escherichia coli]